MKVYYCSLVTVLIEMIASEKNIKRFVVNYRGIFQKTLGKRISTDIVYIAHREGKTALFNGRYSDDPERNGIPAARFAFIGENISEEDLEAEAAAKMDIDNADVVVVLDDTLAKGVEPWGYYGIMPINEKVIPNGVILFVSRRSPQELVKELEKKPFSYKLAVLPGDASFSGLWYYKDDMTDVRVLGAVARVDPKMINIDDVVSYVKEKYKSDQKAEAALKAYDEVVIYNVKPGEGRDWPYKKPELPKWNEFSEGLKVVPPSQEYKIGPRGLNRNPVFKRGTSKTQRPLVRFDLCTKCTLCWYDCPDEVFDVTKDGYYDPNYEYCTGCGRCAEVCPVDDCIVMVDEMNFDNNDSAYEMYKKDPKAYVEWVESKKKNIRKIPEFITGKGEKVIVRDKSIPLKKGGAKE